MPYVVEVVASPTWSYAYAGTRRPIIREIRLTNQGSLPKDDIEVFSRVTLNFPLPEKVAEVWQGSTRVLLSRGPNVGHPIVWDRVPLQINLPLVSRLLEHTTGDLITEIVDSKSGTVLASSSERLTLLPFNMFLWEYGYHDSLAAFVLPSDPFVAEVLGRARELLKATTRSGSTEGYQSDDPHPVEPEKSRVRAIAGAIYEAIRSFNFSYSDPPAALLGIGQRVRTPSQIRDEKCATCLDSTVLMAACLEQAGIESALMLIRGHAFVGYFTGRPYPEEPMKPLFWGSKAVYIWKEEIKKVTNSGVLRGSNDQQLLTTLVGGLHIQPVETTTLTADSSRTFLESCLSQNNFTIAQNLGDIQSIVIPSLAWRAGISPSPLLGNATTAMPFQRIDAPTADPITPENEGLPELSGSEVIQYSERDEKTPPRIRQWKSALLDLSAKNPLLRVKKKALQIDFPPSLLGSLDDQLFTPKFRIPLVSFDEVPLEWIQNGVTEKSYADWIRKSPKLLTPSFREIQEIPRQVQHVMKQIMERDDSLSEVVAQQHAFDAVLASRKSRLRKSVAGLQSDAREKFLSTGVNSLYLTIGSVSWSEQATNRRGQSKVIEWQAPLYLYPIVIEGGRGAPFTIRLDQQGEVTPNYCLHEKLRRLHVDVPELIEPLEDDRGIDIDKMLGSITARLQQNKKTNFAVRSDLFVGVFDFATFRLWMDLNDHWESMAAISPVARHLMLTPNQPFPEDRRDVSLPLPALTPIPADDSQRDAVELALNGTSFRLEGPPGTGKSQTITNLLASCLAYKKKILFVAEKQTALDAVKKRLDVCGLGDFCLNLHAKGDSDTRLRKNITEAITTAQNKDLDPQDQKWEDLRFAIENEERLLNAYRDALHAAQDATESLWSVNELLLEVGSGDLVELPSEFTGRFFDLWPRFRAIMQGVVEALEVAGDPRTNRWRWVQSIVDESQSLELLTKCLTGLLATYRDFASEDPLTLASLDNLNSTQLALLADYIDLVRNGWAPPLSGIGDLGYGPLTSYKEALDTASAPERAALTTISDCRMVNSEFATVASLIDPSVSKTDVFNEALEIVLDLNRILNSSSDLSKLLDRWATLQTAVQQSHALVLTDLLNERDPNRLRSLRRDYVESGDGETIDRIRLGCSRLQSEVKEHLINVAPEFLARGDLVNIDILLNDLESANILNRGKRSRALRDSLGTQAIAKDDRLLLVSLKAIRQSAIRAQELIAEARSMLPDLTPIDWQPWNTADCERLWTAASRKQIEKLRDDLGVPSLPDNREEVTRVLDETLRLLEMTTDCRTSPMGAELRIDLFEYQPWNFFESNRLRNDVTKMKMTSVRHLLGSAVKTTDDEALRDAILRLSQVASRSIAIETQVRTSLLPGIAVDIRLWDSDHVGLIESSSRVSSEMGHLMKDRKAADAVTAVIGASSDLSKSHRLRAMADGWKQLFAIAEIDPIFERDWRTDSLSQAVLSTFPDLIRDAGPNHSFVELRRLLELRSKLKDVAAMGLSKVADLLFYESAQPAGVIESVRRSALSYSFRSLLIEKNLDRFDRRIHERRIATFEAALSESQRLLKIRIPGLVARRQKSKVTLSGKEAGATQSLLRGLKPGRGDRTPIRELIARYGKALSDSLPCFLMSPDSVARLLPVGAVDFDLVVFDEASQVRVSHAIGAIGRAKACVVVGDSKQMPPSSSFSSNKGVFVDDATNAPDSSSDDEPHVDSDDPIGDPDDTSQISYWESAEDMESILEEFAESGFPFRQLLCHYRSRDEALIAFSNHEIYEKPMITFPSIYGDESLAIKYVYVSDGQFERSRDARPYDLGDTVIPALRTNRIEADAVVDEVLSRLRDKGRRKRWLADKSGESESIIVITFNIQQMKLISALLEVADPQAYAEAIQEGEADEITGARRQARLKIRNLENVQGDEADTVIFSVAFSKTPNGKFPLNWGPVTQPKGDRRLNVAVTRARFEMLVFCSFRPDEMISGRNKEELSIEAQRVHSFLQIAHDGPARLRNLAIGTQASRQIEAIAESIRDRGYRVRVQEGLSQLRVDLAVSRKDRDHSELAILVDDCAWRDRGSAFQREVLPRQVLPGLGWKKVMRIWLPAWVNERDAVLAEIDHFFGQLQANALEPATEDSGDDLLKEALDQYGTQTVSALDEPQVVSRHFPFQPYVPTVVGSPDWLDDASKSRSAQTKLLALIQEIIDKESPIEIIRLGRFVGNSLGLSRVTTERIETIRRYVPKEQRVKDAVGEFCWARDMDPEQWTNFRTSLDSAERDRKVEEICAREIGNALFDLVERVHNVPTDDAIRELANIFGFKAVTEKTSDALKRAIKVSLEKGRVQLVDGEFHLPT